MPAEALPEDNGYWSKWYDVPANRREHWMKPGFLKHFADRDYGDPYNPFRCNDTDPPAANWTGTNYFRTHFYNSPDNHTFRPDYFNNRGPGGNGIAYTVVPEPWGARRVTDNSWYGGYYISQVDEMFSNTWYPLDGSVGASGSGPGMGPLWVTSTIPESYYDEANMLQYALPYGSYIKAMPYYTAMSPLGNVGRNGSYAYQLTSIAGGYGAFGMTSLLPWSKYSNGSWSNGWVGSHTYRFSGWVKGGTGTLTNVRLGVMITTKTGTTTRYSDSVTTTPGDNWQEIAVEIRGDELYNSIYSSTTGPVTWSSSEEPAGSALGKSFLLCDLRLEDLTIGPTTHTLHTKDPYCAIRQDSSSSTVECFQRLYDTYGVWGGGEGHPPRTFERIRDATGWSTSRSANQHFRSYGGQKDPRMLTNPMSASFGYSRWMEVHPFCIWYYWTLKANTGMTVGNSYHSWGEGENMRNWEMLLPSDVDPDFPIDLPYTWHRKNYPPSTNTLWGMSRGGGDRLFWRSVDFDGEVEVVDSKFEIEVCGWGYNNTSGAAPCINNTPAPPIPPGEFYLYVVEGNSNNYTANWPGMNGVPGDLLLTITPQWTGSQNGAWTFDGVTFSGSVASTYTLNTATNLGMGVNQNLYGCIPTIKPQDFTSKKVTFFLVEKYGRQTTVPWFITEYDPDANIGNWTQWSSGFGTTHDLTTNSYSNSLTVGIQPLIKYRLPAKWRYAIPWGTPMDEEYAPPLRMAQRDDGVGGYQGHARITGAASSAYSSVNGPRIPGLNATYR